MDPLAALFDQAVRDHQGGDLRRAESLYREILQSNPRHVHAWHLLGLLAGQDGRSELAAECIGQAIQIMPEFADAHFNLGIVLASQGNRDGAKASYRQALRLNPYLAVAHNNLANLLRDEGHLAEAEESFRQAVQLRPDIAEWQCNLGNCLRDRRNLMEAENWFRKAVAVRPTFAEAYYSLGSVLQDQGRLDDAESALREALRLKPNLAKAYHVLGSVLHARKKRTEAESCCREALRLQPGMAEAHNTLAMILRDQEKLEDAETNLRETLRLKPEDVEVRVNLGIVFQELGRLEEAEESLRDALRRDPRLAGARIQLANLLGGRILDADLEAMRLLLTDPDLTPGNHTKLLFSLALVSDARQEYEQASEYLEKANARALVESHQAGRDYDPVAHSQFVDRLIAEFGPAFFERVRGLGVDSNKLIFIVGLPRSGTTLIEQVLGQHSQIFGAGELTVARDNFVRLAGDGASDAQALDNLDRLDGPTILSMAEWQLNQLRSGQDGDRHVVDKMNDNYLYLGFLAALFPRAKFVHCRRDLRDIAVSCWMTDFRFQRWTNTFDHIAVRFQDYERLTNHWRQVLPVPVLELEYQETVADLEGVARRLVTWCGLEWEPACLKFYESKRPVRTASSIQVRQRIFAQSVARWKHYVKSMGPLFAKLPVPPGSEK